MRRWLCARADGWECTAAANTDSLPWIADENKGLSTNPIVQKVIFVSFDSSENSGPEYAADRMFMLSKCEDLFEEQSHGKHAIRYEPVWIPGHPGDMWRLSPEGISDFQSSGDFGTLASVEQFDRFRTSWTGTSAYQGELQARVLELIQRADDAAYGVGNWTSPLSGADAVLLAVAPDAGNLQNPLFRQGYDLGVAKLSLRVNTSDPRIAAVLNGAPGIGRNHAMLGTFVVLGPTHPVRNITATCHLWGHMLGLDHVANHLDPNWVPGAAGAYSLMVPFLPEQESAYPRYALIDHPSRALLQWASPVFVGENLRDVALTDGSLFRIPIAHSDRLVQPEQNPLTWWKAAVTEYYLVAYEDGHAINYGAPDTGMFIWHCLDATAIWYSDAPGRTSEDELRCRFTQRDLEVATGLFDDPGLWTSPNTVLGYDTLDNWFMRNPVEPFHWYWGTNQDLFKFGGNHEFSYRTEAPHSVNPSAFGYAYDAGSVEQDDCLIPPVGEPQAVPTSIIVRITGMRSNGVIADLLVAPFVAVLHPNGGEACQVGAPCEITWDTEYAVGHPNGIVNTVDIYCNLGGPADDILLASGVNAAQGSYVWTPDANHIGQSCKIKIVCHNTTSSDVGIDESDVPFTVVGLPVAQFTDVSSQTGLVPPGVPYSAVPCDFQPDGMNDLLITATGGWVNMGHTTLVQSSGAPRFSNVTVSNVTNGRGAAVADFDNDGDQDFFLAHETTPKLYRNQSGTFFDVTASIGLSDLAAPSTAACWGDYDRDGWLDLYVVRSRNGNTEPPDYLNIAGEGHRLFRNMGATSGGFVDVTAAAGISGLAGNGSVSASWADIDKDGDLDLIVTNLQEPPTGAPGGIGNHLFVNQGNGTFTEEFLDRFPGQFYYCTAAQWADMNNDGYLDLAVSCAQSGSAIYFNDGAGHFPAADRVWFPDPATATGNGYNGVQVFDHDLDGWKDVLWISRNTAEPSHFFSGVPTATGVAFVNNTANVGLTGSSKAMGAVAADFTHDGDLDLFVGRPSSSGQYFYKTDARSGGNSLGRNYVKVRLDSPLKANNRQGIGATVTVTAGDLVQMQAVDGGSGRGGQRDRDLIFGLDDYSGAVTASVSWPRGYHQNDMPLVISNSTAEVLNTITDETMAISNLNVATIIVPETGLFDWVFSWDTNVACNPSQDLLTFDQVGIENPCWPGWTVLTSSTPGVEYVYEPKSGGGYLHKFTIYGEECNLDCSFRYTALSAMGTNQATSATKTKRVTFCPSGF